LGENEKHGGGGLTAEKHRLNKRIANELTQGFDFILDHGGNFRRLDALEMSAGKAQHSINQLKTQSPQSSFANFSFEQIDVKLEITIDAHQ